MHSGIACSKTPLVRRVQTQNCQQGLIYTHPILSGSACSSAVGAYGRAVRLPPPLPLRRQVLARFGSSGNGHSSSRSSGDWGDGHGAGAGATAAGGSSGSAPGGSGSSPAGAGGDSLDPDAAEAGRRVNQLLALAGAVTLELVVTGGAWEDRVWGGGVGRERGQIGRVWDCAGSAGAREM